MKVRFEQLRVAELGDEVWQGVRNKYWHFPLYFLPSVTHAPDNNQDEAAAAEPQPLQTQQ